MTVVDAWQRGIAWRDVPAYLGAQLIGAVAGVVVANVMFGLPPISISHRSRAGGAQRLGDFVATFGLLAVSWGCARSRPGATPFAVAASIVGAYWPTSSTSFANPAVTIARSLSDSFAGIRPVDVAPFIGAQFAGAVAATALFGWLAPISGSSAQAVLSGHPSSLGAHDAFDRRRGHAAP